MVLIGIGNAGCNLINAFGDHHKKIAINYSDFPKKCNTTEEYEEHCPNFTKRLKFSESECWVALSGTGKISGATLRILEKIKHKKINKLYICPDIDITGIIQQKRNRVVFSVLQQFTRSGLLNRMYLFSNTHILNMIGDQTLTTMYEMVNKQIAHAVETFEWFKSQEPMMGSQHEPKEISRIGTLSVGDFKKNEEKLMYPLDNTTEAGYIYSISKTNLEKNKNLLKLIKERIAKDKENKIISSFLIYPSEHKQSFFYSLKLSHVIQTLEAK